MAEESYKELESKYLDLIDELEKVKKERDTYNDIFSMSPNLLCIADIESFKLLKINPSFTKVLGYSADELLGSSFLDFIHPDDVQSTIAIVEKKLKEGKIVLNFVNRYRCADGTYKWLEWLSQPRKEKNITFASAHEITSRIELEKTLRENEGFTKIVMENLPIGIAVNTVDPAAVNFKYMNNNFPKIYRTTKNALANPESFWNSVYEDQEFREKIKKRVIEDCLTNDPDKMIWDNVPITRKGMETKYISARNIPIPEKGLMLSIVQDVTKRKKTEEDLIETKRLLEETQSITKLGGWEYDVGERKLVWTKEVFNIHGIKEVKNPVDLKNATDFYGPENNEKIEKHFIRAIKKGEPYDIQTELTRLDGKKIWIRTIGHPVSENGKVVRVTGNIMDITEIKEAEIALRESEARFKALHNASFGGIAIHDKGRIIDCNEGLSILTGYSKSELVGSNGLNLIKRENRKRVIEEYNSESNNPFESLCITKDGDEVPVLLKSKKIPYKGRDVRVVEFRDISEQKKAETEREMLRSKLTQSQKMEAIGTLAGGIAHDFNNILSLILGYSDMLKKNLSDPSNLNDLNQIIQAGNRAKELVNQILTFSRHNKEKFEDINPSSVINEALKMLRASIPTTIKIKKSVPNCGSILGDQTQLHQIVMNLCTNAYHAMREKGGVLEVKLSPVTLKRYDRMILSSRLSPGKYLKLLIKDTGHGFDEVVKGKIFDPYFTTKEKGEGTGLGLAVVHGIVQNFNGHITVQSKPGEGTSFNIYFPVIKTDEKREEAMRPDEIPGGDEHILIVDDEELIMEMEQQMLESLGYKITSFSKSPEALKAFNETPDAFDVVITDMTMPDMTGVELMTQMRMIKPDLPVILCSGFSELINKEKAERMGRCKYLMKPVMMSDFAFAIREVLRTKKRFNSINQNHY